MIVWKVTTWFGQALSGFCLPNHMQHVGDLNYIISPFAPCNIMNYYSSVYTTSHNTLILNRVVAYCLQWYWQLIWLAHPTGTLINWWSRRGWRLSAASSVDNSSIVISYYKSMTKKHTKQRGQLCTHCMITCQHTVHNPPHLCTWMLGWGQKRLGIQKCHQ